MTPGDLVQIDCSGQTSPMYPDEGTGMFGEPTAHIGYAKPGTICIFLSSVRLKDSSRGLIFYRLIMPEHGIVWVRNAWVKEVS